MRAHDLAKLLLRLPDEEVNTLGCCGNCYVNRIEVGDVGTITLTSDDGYTWETFSATHAIELRCDKCGAEGVVHHYDCLDPRLP